MVRELVYDLVQRVLVFLLYLWLLLHDTSCLPLLTVL